MKTRDVILFPVVVLSSQWSFGQTSNISGIINSYYPVDKILPANDGVIVLNPAGLSQHDKIMIIQMKGASINTSNSASFGDTMSLNNAGNYEIATICSIQNDTIYLFFNLLNSYTISGKVQLVKFAEYSSAMVVDTVKALPWDNSTGTGGVIAISVDDDLTLNAPIYADSSGFRGGNIKLSNGTCGNGFPIPVANAYYYDANSLSPQNGGFKGEAIVDLVASQSGGRGAAANGGGGGNNHNNGGGGGANLSTGGRGGGNSSSAGCTSNLRGEAGKALSNWGGQKIFFGGGGGAGHANDGFVSSWGAGHGGGIIFISANNLISNISKISANGQSGGPALSDGASGGGAGGTIIMDIFNSYSGILTIEANGGSGGTENDGGNINRCYGGGGGGSGGAIYFNGSLPAVNITATAGAAGPETGRDAGCNAAVPALAGATGSINSFYTYARPFDPAGSCHSVLAVQVIYFSLSRKQDLVEIDCKLANPEEVRNILVQKWIEGLGWINLDTIIANDHVQEYKSMDASPLPGKNQYRLKVIEKDRSFIYSTVKQLYFSGLAEQYKIYPNPAGRQLTIAGKFPGGTSIRLYDLSGRLVMEKKSTVNNYEVKLELEGLASGIYVLRINDVVKKLIIDY